MSVSYPIVIGPIQGRKDPPSEAKTTQPKLAETIQVDSPQQALTFDLTVNMEGAWKAVIFSQSFRRFASRQVHTSTVNRFRQCSCLMQLPRERLELRYEDYKTIFQRSIETPEEFWAEQAEHIVWDKKWTTVLDNSRPPFTKWYVSWYCKVFLPA